MKHKNSLRLLILTLIGMIMYSCQNDDEINPQVVEQQAPTEGLIKLGEKLENPYSVENMQKALDNLKKSNLSAKSSSVNDIEITTTHLYLRFKPKNEEELNILEIDSTFVLYDYPLDYEITEIGDFYKDPEVTGEQPTYQYCAVPVDKKLPDGVEHELLAKLFIPDEYSDKKDETGKSSKSYSVELVDALVDEALRITNNLDGLQSKTAKVTASKWRPAGTIKVWDDVLRDYIGVEGVQVRARRWFTTHRGFVNANGSYSCDGEFRRDANYSIDWERYEFALQDGWLNGATYNGPKRRGNWDLNLDSGEQEYYATIFSAAYFYYYGTRMGLSSPPTNGTFKRQMKIAAERTVGTSSHIHQRRFILSAPIYIKNYGLLSDQIFGTTIHELAHAAHWDLDEQAYNHLGFNGYIVGNDGDKRTLETWATTVEIILTVDRYVTKLNRIDYEYEFQNRQDYPIESQPFYTSLGVDLIDNINQNTDIVRNLFGTYAQDRVSGYTINQIENSLRNTRSWQQWKENLILQNPNNPTNIHLDELFNNW